MTKDELKVVVALVSQWGRREKNIAGEQCLSSGGHDANMAAISLLVRYGLMEGLDNFGNRAKWTAAGRELGGID
jgi:hypothetical protein